jgi:hypothetical protein
MFGSFYRLIPIKTIENLSKYDHNVTPVVAEGVASAGQFTIRTCQMERKKNSPRAVRAWSRWSDKDAVPVDRGETADMREI